MSRIPSMPVFSRLFLAIFASLFLLSTSGSATSKQAVRTTPVGGFVIGNPNAPIKLVEYLSYTCPHCAQFEMVDLPKIDQAYIANGEASLEFRNYWRDGIDMTMAMLARCGGPSKFLANHRHIMATQAQWRPRAASLSRETASHFHGDYGTGAYVDLDEMVTYMLGVYDQLKLADIIAPLKITPAAAKQCISDKIALRQILLMTDDAIITHAIPGTPSLLYNGKYDETIYDFATLKARVDSGKP